MSRQCPSCGFNVFPVGENLYKCVYCEQYFRVKDGGLVPYALRVYPVDLKEIKAGIDVDKFKEGGLKKPKPRQRVEPASEAELLKDSRFHQYLREDFSELPNPLYDYKMADPKTKAVIRDQFYEWLEKQRNLFR